MSGSISRYHRSDLGALLDFRAACYGEGSLRADRAYVEWLYDAGPCAGAENASLFVCRAGSRIVGTQGLVRVDLKAGTHMLPAAWAIDFAVRQDSLRGLGLGLGGVGAAIGRVSRKEVSVRLAMDVTDAAAVVARRNGWVRVCTVPLWMRALDPAALLRARGASGKALASAPAVRLALRALDARGARRAARDRVRLVPTPAFDERADAIWSAASPAYPLACRRDHRYLSWRFDRFAATDGYTRFWLQEAGQIVGYAVLSIGMHRGVPAGYLIDYFCRPALAPSLLVRCLDVFRKAGVVAMYCLNLTPLADSLFRPLGFLRRESGWSFMIYAKATPPETRALMANASNWFITSGDSNVDHVRSASAASPS